MNMPCLCYLFRNTLWLISMVDDHLNVRSAETLKQVALKGGRDVMRSVMRNVWCGGIKKLLFQVMIEKGVSG